MNKFAHVNNSIYICHMKNSKQLEKEFVELAKNTDGVTDINSFVLGCFLAKYDSLLYDYEQLKKEYESKSR